MATDVDALAFCRRAFAWLERIDVEAARGSPQPATCDDAAPVLRTMAGGLVVAYVVADGATRRHVVHGDLRVAAMALDALHAVALANLAAAARARSEIHRYGHIHAVLVGGDLEASLLLCDAFWDDWHAGLAPGGFVAAVPGRDVLAFGDASSAIAVHELEDLCTRMEPALDEPITDRLLRRMGGRWVALSA
jgi:hypothetical protein